MMMRMRKQFQMKKKALIMRKKEPMNQVMKKPLKNLQLKSRKAKMRAQNRMLCPERHKLMKRQQQEAWKQARIMIPMRVIFGKPVICRMRKRNG